MSRATGCSLAQHPPVGTGEMLSSLSDMLAYVDTGSLDVAMPEAPRPGGITPFIVVCVRGFIPFYDKVRPVLLCHVK